MSIYGFIVYRLENSIDFINFDDLKSHVDDHVISGYIKLYQ